MNNLIEIKLQVTALQLTAIAQVLNGDAPVITPAPAAATVETPAAPAVEQESTPATTFADAPAATTDATPPPPPATNTDAQTTTETPPPPAGVETAKGLNGQQIPWDARIHGSAKKKNADGSWRLKQGVDRDVLVPQVEAELIAALGATPAPKPVEAATASSPEQTAATPPPPAAATTTAPAAAQPANGGAAVPPPPAAQTSAAKPATFAELLPVVTAAKAAGTLTDEKIAETCAALGLAQFGLIATRPDLIPQMVELLGV